MSAVLTRILPVAWTTLIVVLVPLQSIVTRRLLLGRRPAPMRAYASTVRGLALVGLVTLAVDLAGPRAGVRALLVRLPWGRLVTWSAGTLAACIVVSLAVMGVRRALRRPLDPGVSALLPATGPEHAAFLGVSAIAGLVEEYVMRGFCLAILAALTHSMPVAFALVTVSFGLAHGYQGPLSALRATALGAVLGVPVLATGALAPSIVAHAATNALSGVGTRAIARRMGLGA